MDELKSDLSVCPQDYIPLWLLLQWHVTERCNLNCRHCYQDTAPAEDLSFSDLLSIMEQYKEFLARIYGRHGRNLLRGQITVTGGEPFIRDDFLDLLDIFYLNRRDFNFAILSNGTYIDRKMANFLKKRKPFFVQISIDGGEQTHDMIRGEGSYRKAVEGIKRLVSADIPVSLSFTAHRDNYTEFADVVMLGHKLNVARVWTDRWIPSSKDDHLQSLTPAMTDHYIEIVRRLNGRSGKTKVTAHRALQGLGNWKKTYSCNAGGSLITVMANGDLVPCRRMPIKVGNLMSDNFTRVYLKSLLLDKLRLPNNIPEECHGCKDAEFCRGGLKCLSYALYRDPIRKDPGCSR